VKVHEVDGDMEESLKREIEERCKDWAEHRKGTQIHLTGVRPFDDMVHRRYFYARDKGGKVKAFFQVHVDNTELYPQMCALVVLAQLSVAHGFQIKWALEFPDAPLGAIEVRYSALYRSIPILTFLVVHFGSCHQEDGRCRCQNRYLRCRCHCGNDAG
jgi:hypothetical protein